LLGYSFYELILIFLIYGFIGWCGEVITATVQTGNFVNRGFLNSPFCPIYGFGVIMVIIFLTPFKWSLSILFIGSMLLATLLEFTTSYILEKNFKQKWWNYSNERFNIKGYVCLKTSLIWGVACVIVMYILQPFTINFVHWIPTGVGIIIVILLPLILVVDTIVTIISLSKVMKQVRILEETGNRIRSLSDLIGKNISDNVITAIDFKNKYLQELDDLNKKYQIILNKKVIGYERISKAFPKLHLIKTKKPTDST